jgi:hypothetical protein
LSSWNVSEKPAVKVVRLEIQRVLEETLIDLAAASSFGGRAERLGGS